MNSPMCVFITGRQPAISLAELEALYGSDTVQAIDGAAVVDVPPERVDFNRLGGSLKAGKILTILTGHDVKTHLNYIKNSLPQHVAALPEGKLTFGISLYGLHYKSQQLVRDVLEIKKLLKATGRPVRAVTNKFIDLSSAQVLHNDLTGPLGMELMLIRSGDNTLLAQTFGIQDLDAYTARDQTRPARDARVGMLPPKLAQIIINLASGAIGDGRWELEDSSSPTPNFDLSQMVSAVEPRTPPILLDPFCGTGVILQEALLMGYEVIGTDLEARMIDFTRQNLEWLVSKDQKLVNGKWEVSAADATNYKWPEVARVRAVASETYLGKPMPAHPTKEEVDVEKSAVSQLLRAFLKNIATQVQPGTRFCLAIPAWHVNNQVITLPIIDQLPSLGYNLVSFRHSSNTDLIYRREDQVVGRQLITFVKRINDVKS